jgi:hypothetical protein
VHVVQFLVERERIPLMAEMVRRSACLGSKSVDARTISSPTRQPAAFRTSIEVLPASAVLASLVQVFVPITVQVQGSAHEQNAAVNAVVRSTHSTDIFVFDVVGEGDVALRVWGLASVPISSSPCNMIHSVVSSRSALLAKLSLPSIVRLPSAGGLTSRSTYLSFAMVTLSPAAGTFRSGQVADRTSASV